MRVTAGWERAGALPVYRAAPAVGGPAPGVVVLMEVWGVDEHVQDVVRRFADSGYAALAPDLYALDGSKPAAVEPARIEELKAFRDSLPPAEWMDDARRAAALERLQEPQRSNLAETVALAFAAERDWDTLVSAMSTAAGYLRADQACDGRVATVGFCLGGRLAAELACADPELTGAVLFYGSPPRIERIPAIACPLLAVCGEEDTRILETLPGFRDALAETAKTIETLVYPGAPHAFFNDTRPSYRAGPSRDAWARTLAFLADCLSSPSTPVRAGA